ncbi:MAG TPA: hypothetical protein H9922_11905, partial [Candidatus Phocaeicola caecigallinarum]|nr:hypothetical protein [Candidatus Phocaeicola caecigallinarum]
ARYLPHHKSENASKTHPKSSHDKFKTASQAKNAVGILSQLCQTKKRRIPVAALQLLQMTINKIVSRQGGSKEKNVTYK